MSDFAREWEAAVGVLRPQLEAMHATREQALVRTRALIQTCSKCIRHVHRGQIAEAEGLLAKASDLAREARASLSAHPNLLYAGYLQDAEKEYVEAAAVLAILDQRPLPSAADLGVDATSYLNGMGEAASECRRSLLDRMRAGNVEEASRILDAMEQIYDELICIDYPDSMTGGLRRTCDALRAVIERTRSDLTMTQVQQELMAKLDQARRG